MKTKKKKNISITSTKWRDSTNILIVEEFVFHFRRINKFISSKKNFHEQIHSDNFRHILIRPTNFELPSLISEHRDIFWSGRGIKKMYHEEMNEFVRLNSFHRIEIYLLAWNGNMNILSILSVELLPQHFPLIRSLC